jgi:FkbM family methyltransferase
MVRPAVPDPPALEFPLWRGFSGKYGWDVGANCGQSISAMNTAFERFTCFEPCQSSFEYLQRTRPWADVLQLALSDRDGRLELAFPADEQKETGQLVTPGLKGMEWEPPDWDAVERVVVSCRTADWMATVLGMPDFVKVDTEGHEVHVLYGAGTLLAAGTNFLIEFHSPENHVACERILQDAGYSIEVVRHPYYDVESPMWHQHGWLRAFS